MNFGYLFQNGDCLLYIRSKSIAKRKPKYRVRRKSTYIILQLDHAMRLKEKYSFSQVEEMTGISMSTLKRESAKRKRF